jgi:hypothetical protein
MRLPCLGKHNFYETGQLLGNGLVVVQIWQGSETRRSCLELDGPNDFLNNLSCLCGGLEANRRKANRKASIMWALLMARIFEVMPLKCPRKITARQHNALTAAKQSKLLAS